MSCCDGFCSCYVDGLRDGFALGYKSGRRHGYVNGYLDGYSDAVGQIAPLGVYPDLLSGRMKPIQPAGALRFIGPPELCYCPGICLCGRR
jgi:hypothetical protein